MDEVRVGRLPLLTARLAPLALAFSLAPSVAHADWFKDKVVNPIKDGADHLKNEVKDHVINPIVEGAQHAEKELENHVAHPIGEGVQHLLRQVGWDTSKDPIGAAMGLVNHVADEALEIGMRVLPGELREGVVTLTKSALKELEKFPFVGSYIADTIRGRLPVLSRIIDRIIHRSCDAPDILAHLSRDPQYKLDSFAQNAAAVTTPLFKETGVSGWSNTGCAATADGVLVRDAQHSADGFWTLDIRLNRLTIDGLDAPPDRFIRVEAEPRTAANAYAETAQLKHNDRVLVRGLVLFDNDPPRPFLEIHPIDDLYRTGDLPASITQGLTPPVATWPRKYVVVKGDCLSWLAERTYGRQIWSKVYEANRKLIRLPDIIFPGTELLLPAP